MNNVISLVPPKHVGPDPGLIAEIEGLLAQAKTGELQGIAYAALYGDCTFKTDWNGTSSALATNGAVAMLAFDFANAVNQIPPEDD